MSSPPSGHDPTQSLLQGGNATITPLMGGGGHGNPEDSLLSGGTTTPIVPLQGGSRPRSRRSKRGAETQDGGAYKEAELYSKDVPPGTKPLEDKTNKFVDRVREYRAKANTAWQRSHKGEKNVTVPILPMKTQMTRLTDGQLMGMYDRLAIVLSQNVKNITIFPPIGGDEGLLQRCIDYIREPKRNDSNSVFIFSPGIFKFDDPPEKNKKILAALLLLTSDDSGLKSKIFLMANNVVEEARLGLTLTADETDAVGIVNLLGPTYIIFPFECKVKEFKAKMSQGSETENKAVGGLIITAAPTKEQVIPACKLANVTRGVRDFIAHIGLSFEGTFKTIAFPPNLGINEIITSLSPYKVFYTQPSNAKFYFKDAKSNDMLRFKLDEPALPDAAERGFSRVPESSLALAQTYLVNNYYRIREATVQVLQNWNELKFTGSELDFLKSLNLDDMNMLEYLADRDDTPGMIIADFMRSISKDCRTKAEQNMETDCDGVREFLDKVVAYRTLIKIPDEGDDEGNDEGDDEGDEGQGGGGDFITPLLSPENTQGGDDREQDIYDLEAEIDRLEREKKDLEEQLAKTKKDKEETEANLAKTPFDSKYFQSPYPTIPNLWPEFGPLGGGPSKPSVVDPESDKSLQGSEIKIGVDYTPNKITPPQGKSILCEKIRVRKVEQNQGAFKLSKVEYTVELCSIDDAAKEKSEGLQTLYAVFKSLTQNFPGWFFSYN